MKHIRSRFLLIVLIVLALIALSTQSIRADGPPADALVLIDAVTPAEMDQTAQFITGQGGVVLLTFAPRALLVQLPPSGSADWPGQAGITAIYTEPVDAGAIDADYGDQAGQAARLWNEWLTPPPPPAPLGSMPPNDVLAPPALPPDQISIQNAPQAYQTSDYLYGSVQVDLFLIESNGGGENWSTTRRDRVVSEVGAGLSWWSATATQGGRPGANLSFNLTVHDPYNEPATVATSYEPITLSSDDDGLWIEEVMGRLGYTGSAYYAARKYANDRRVAFGRKWGLVIFVVDSLNDSDGMFSNGGFGYAYLYGPYLVMTYDNDGWGINNMEMVTAHETAHIFGGLDEYASSGCTTSEYSGYLRIANTNCENGSPTEDSIMRSSANQHVAYPAHMVSTPVRGMVGWRDSDADGLYDPVDTTPSLSLTPYSPDPATTNTPQYTGSTRDVPYDSPSRTPATINTIAGVEYRADGGSWLACAPTDGNFNTWQEGYTCAAGPLTDGAHTIQVRSRNSVNNYSASASDVVTIDTTSPANPSDIASGCAATNNTWQNECNDPAFIWSGAMDAVSGVAGYQVYWGTSPTGTSTTWTTAAAYDPAAVSPGSYYLRLRTKDNVGNWSAWVTGFTFRYDDTPPALQILAPAADTYLNVNSAIVQATGSDTPSGLARFQFFAGYDDGSGWNWHSLGWDVNGADGWQEHWDASGIADQASVAFYAYVWDQAGNEAGTGVYNITLDRTPPVASIRPLPGSITSTTFSLSWSGQDTLSGLKSYDIQYKAGSNGPWTDLWTSTPDTSGWFSGQMGQTYYFQARARDQAGNVEAYPGSSGDTQVFIQLCSGDNYEEDDTYQTARRIDPNGIPQHHNFCGVGDEDWLSFEAKAGRSYRIETGNLPYWTDTYLHLYGPDGQTQLAENDDVDSGDSLASSFEWIAAASGRYYLKTHNFNSATAGNGVTYDLTVSPLNFEVYLPLLLKGTAGGGAKTEPIMDTPTTPRAMLSKTQGLITTELPPLPDRVTSPQPTPLPPQLMPATAQ